MSGTQSFCLMTLNVTSHNSDMSVLNSHHHRQKLSINSEIYRSETQLSKNYNRSETHKKGKLTRYRTEAANSCLSTGVTLWQIANNWWTLLVTAQTTGCATKNNNLNDNSLSTIKITEIKKQKPLDAIFGNRMKHKVQMQHFSKFMRQNQTRTNKKILKFTA